MEKMKKITTIIDNEIWKQIKIHHWHYNELITYGVQQKLNQPLIQDRLTKQEENILKLQRRLAFYIGRLEEKGGI